MKTKKSKSVKRVLRLMDDDYTYCQALKIALSENKKINRGTLENTLTKYI